MPGSFDCFCCPHTSVHRPSIACLAVFLCGPGPPPPGPTFGRKSNLLKDKLGRGHWWTTNFWVADPPPPLLKHPPPLPKGPRGLVPTPPPPTSPASHPPHVPQTGHVADLVEGLLRSYMAQLIPKAKLRAQHLLTNRELLENKELHPIRFLLQLFQGLKPTKNFRHLNLFIDGLRQVRGRGGALAGNLTAECGGLSHGFRHPRAPTVCWRKGEESRPGLILTSLQRWGVPPPPKRLGQFSSAPLANQNFSLAPLAPMSFDEKIFFGAFGASKTSAPLERGGGG